MVDLSGNMWNLTLQPQQTWYQQELLLGHTTAKVWIATTTTPKNLWSWGPFHHEPRSFMQERRLYNSSPQPDTRSYRQTFKDHVSWCIDWTNTLETNWWITTWKNCKYHRWDTRRYCCLRVLNFWSTGTFWYKYIRTNGPAVWKSRTH